MRVLEGALVGAAAVLLLTDETAARSA